MAHDTRRLMLDTAEYLFAERGFYGVSIAAIADELSLTKQALLHHFSSKEKLYGEVLQRISRQFEELEHQSKCDHDEPAVRVKAFFLELQSPKKRHIVQTRLLMRELLDNKHRAEKAEAWYLKSFLNTLIKMVRDVDGWKNATDVEILALVYQWLGAINYFAISDPTLSAIFGKKMFRELVNIQPKQLDRMIEATLAIPPTTTS